MLTTAALLSQAVTYLLAVSAIVVALVGLWNLVFKPIGRRILEQIKDEEIKPIVQEIAEQYRSNAGRLEKTTTDAALAFERMEAAFATHAAALKALHDDMSVAMETLRRETGAATEQLRIGAGIAGGLAEQDRKTLDRLAEALRVVTVDSARGAATGLRLEDTARSVADNLAAAQERADSTTDDSPGAAADAASLPPDTQDTQD